MVVTVDDTKQHVLFVEPSVVAEMAQNFIARTLCELK